MAYSPSTATRDLFSSGGDYNIEEDARLLST
jgi:hypothetical protein